RASVAEQGPEELVGDVDLYAEARCHLVPPLPHVGDAREDQRESERDWAFVEALLAAADAHGTVVIHPAPEVDGKMLVGAEIIDDRVAALAEDHRGVERAGPAGEVESARPGHSLAAEPIYVGVVGDRERDA